jgi:hypothetical protein
MVASLKSYNILVGATYEVKTKKDIEAVEKTLLRNALQGGSFSAWCQLKASKQQASIPTYLVLLPRQFTQNRKLESSKFYSCMLIELRNVLYYLRLCVLNKCFLIIQYQFIQSTIHFKSTISLKLSSKAKWFDLPYTDEFTGVVLDSIAEKVYKELFSEELFECFSSTYSDSDRTYTKKDTDESSLSINNGEIDDVESVTTKFQDIRVVPDDWEDLASDSD